MHNPSLEVQQRVSQKVRQTMQSLWLRLLQAERAPRVIAACASNNRQWIREKANAHPSSPSEAIQQWPYQNSQIPLRQANVRWWVRRLLRETLWPCFWHTRLRRLLSRRYARRSARLDRLPQRNRESNVRADTKSGANGRRETLHASTHVRHCRHATAKAAFFDSI